MFKGVNVSQPSDGVHRKTEVFRGQFFVSLADNIERRLDNNEIISAAATINPSNWPSDGDECILYGDEKLLTMLRTQITSILLKELQI